MYVTFTYTGSRLINVHFDLPLLQKYPGITYRIYRRIKPTFFPRKSYLKRRCVLYVGASYTPANTNNIGNVV